MTASESERSADLRKRFMPQSRLPGERSALYQIETDRVAARWQNVHDGKGQAGVTRFDFGNSALPVSFVTFEFPPQTSEGLHTHELDDPEEGSFDEFYYIVAGQGQMRIHDRLVAVAAGDHVFVPIGVPHGIENVSETETLKVLLTFVFR